MTRRFSQVANVPPDTAGSPCDKIVDFIDKRWDYVLWIGLVLLFFDRRESKDFFLGQLA